MRTGKDGVVLEKRRCRMGDCSMTPSPTLRAAEDCTLNACPSARLLDMKRVSAGIDVTLESLQCTTRTTPVVLYI